MSDLIHRMRHPRHHGMNIAQLGGMDLRGAELASLVLTSIPSLLTANSSKLSTAVLIIWMGGSTVRPMLMALLLLGSNTTTTFFPSMAFCKEDRMGGDSQAKASPS